MRRLRNIDGLMISSSDVRCNVKNEMNVIHRRKNVNENIIINNSNNREEVKDSSWFLKGDTVTSL